MISQSHKTIFVHIPKCGGQSVEHMFLDDLGLTWKQRSPLLLRRNPSSPDLGPPRLAHLVARDYVRFGYISQEEFDAYFKFTVVRDPYKRALSFFNYLKVGGARSGMLQSIVGEKVATALSGWKPISLDDFFLAWLPAQFAAGDETGQDSRFWFVRPQSDYVFDNAGAQILDRVIRLESLSGDIEDIRESCQLKSELKHINKSKVKVVAQDLQPRHLEVIEDLYAADFDNFGYDRRAR